MDQLLNELVVSAKSAKRFAVRNYILAYIVSGVTVISSIAAALMFSISSIPSYVPGILASLPAAMVGANTVFRFDQKSAWFWKKNKRIESLVRRLQYEGAPVVEISKEFSSLEESMEQEWITFGNLVKDQD